MKDFNTVLPEQWAENPFAAIGKQWMLITAGDIEKNNAMTASWGGVGILWNRPVAFLFIRPQRYTYEFAENGDTLTACFFDEAHRAALRYCGTHSGRDGDKAAECGLTRITSDSGAVYYEEARTVLVLKKLYADDLKACGFLDPSLLENYKDGDFHRVYICEIQEVLEKSK